MKYQTLLTIALAATLTVAVGCEKKEPQKAETDAKAAAEEKASEAEKPSAEEKPSDEAETTQKDQAVEAPAGWKVVDQAKLSEAQQGGLDKAKSAQKMLGKTLLKELTTTSANEGFPAAVEVCNVRAPEIAEKVERETDVAIGRTSFKLRNPDNKPPEWAEPFVEARVAEPTLLESESGDMLAYLAPIKLAGMCTNCHGPEDKIDPGVKEKLAELYPQDQATGFEPGDLRGWFWVEVPES